MSNAILELNDLQKSYGDVEVLRQISLEMQPGDFLVLLGPSGCGKSTLLNCIAGLACTGSLVSKQSDLVERRL